MIGTLPMNLGHVAKDPPTGFHERIPQVFGSLEEARNSWDYHWNGCIRLFNGLHDIDVNGLNWGTTEAYEAKIELYRSDRNRYVEIFHAWENAFKAFLSDKWESLDTLAQNGVRVLQMMTISAYTSLDSFTDDVTKETIWDKYFPQYKRSVELAEAILESSGNSHPYFCLEMNYVAPLYAVAHKCRDPKIRRKAVAVLYSSSRQEGIWDSIMAARVAERLIQLEEDGLGEVTRCEDVPDWARLSAVEVKFDYLGRLGMVKYSRAFATEPMKRQDFTEVVNW